MGSAEPHIETIEGRQVLVIDRRPPLQATIGEVIAHLTVTYRAPVKIQGWRGECDRQDHRFAHVLSGRHLGTDGVWRDLQFHQCQDCEAMCIRDVSIDLLPGLDSGRLGPRRKNHILAWSTGSRKNQRTYSGAT